ncbi:lysozyme inhibitor LprI family protein [Pseudoduganella violaceinigra]|uniref:lysozyme inhibitor LprI family protein n=1 Tax=Pseudoduganella violaceinigra TaxID=246602 RepID=UPI000408CB95|nr:lysozyme inhibitor LprI family protein [Pseudoduganella violaceinigra]
MKRWIFSFAASLLCLASAAASTCAGISETNALNRCLDGELEQKSRTAEELARRAADAKPSTEGRRLLEDFAEWRKSTLLACSIASQEHADAEIREIQRKNCLIERTSERIYTSSQPRP